MPGREEKAEAVSNLFSPHACMGAGHTVTTSLKTTGALEENEEAQPVEGRKAFSL